MWAIFAVLRTCRDVPPDVPFSMTDENAKPEILGRLAADMKPFLHDGRATRNMTSSQFERCVGLQVANATKTIPYVRATRANQFIKIQ